MKTFCLFFILFSLIYKSGVCQPNFPEKELVFRTDIIPKVIITIHPDTLQWIYENVDSDKEFKSLFVFASAGEIDTIENVGFRLRGNTSRYSAKKSFKISFNTFESGRKFHGLEKMNLNGEHNDPSISRAYLTWELFEKMFVPGSRCNHVDVYINNEYFGLYLNVEHIDEEFVESRYTNKFGNLYKCLYPANLIYLGTNKENYKNNGYELHTNTEEDDFSDLINLTKVLNSSNSDNLPQNLEPIFNVNGFLRYLAVEIFTGHWDAYSFNKNNFYLYNNPYTGKFEFIPYDVDNTFGIDWFGIDWGTRNIYQWWSDSEERPLTSKIMGNTVYRDRFSYFMKELIIKYANTDSIFPEIDSLKNKISPSAEADFYRTFDYGWSYNDFLRSFSETLGAHVKYGIKPYLTTRINSANNQIDIQPIAPIIENIYHNFPLAADDIQITAWLTDDETNPSLKLFYQINGNETHSVTMEFVQGNKYKGVIPALNSNGTVTFYLVATDQSNNSTREPYSGNYTLNFGNSTTQLVINELMAGNTETIVDNYGQTSDWIEIKNTGQVPISLKGKYLTDDRTDITKWQFPNVTLEPGAYYLVWADNDPKQGENHANFKLNQNGEFLGLFDGYDQQFSVIDTINYTPQDENISYGINTNGTFTQQDFITPNSENGNTTAAFVTLNYNMNKQIDKGEFNPSNDFLDIAGTFNDWAGSEKVYDANEDGFYSITLFNFTGGDEIEYKARINANWGTAEFPEQGGDGNRKYTVIPGFNSLTHWYNDEELTINPSAKISSLKVFPNPNIGSDINILATGGPLGEIIIYSMQGTLIFKTFTTENRIKLQLRLSPGLYLVCIRKSCCTQTNKLIVKP